MGLIGGIGSEKKIDDQTQELVAKIQPELETKLDKSFKTFQAVSYKSQLVNGMNYFVKVKTDDGYDHLRIFSPTGGPPKLVSVQQGKTLEEEITYF